MIRKFLKWTAAGIGLLVIGLVSWCLIPVRPTIAHIKPRSSTRYWAMHNGHRIAYTCIPSHANGPKPPIIFLHGGPGGYVHSSAINTLGRLAALGHDVYLYDQVGSGLSDRLPRPKDYTFLGHVADLHEIVTQHLRAPKVILIGHSYGGQLAAQYVADHSELVDRMVLDSPGSIQPQLFDKEGRWINESKYVPPASMKFTELEGSGDPVWAMPLRAIASVAVSTMFNKKLMPDDEADGVLNTLASRFTREMVCKPEHVQPEEGGCGFYVHGGSNYYGDLQDPRPKLRQVATPVLVLQGSCDYIPYASTYEYVDLLENSTYTFIAGAGHLISWDKPTEYVEAISRFVQ